jgi:DNA-binding beta-propeller fold protein YncE
MRTTLTAIVAGLTLLLAPLGVGSTGLLAAAGQYAKVGEIHIGGAGRFDYLNVDSAAQRLYVSHGTEFVVIDLKTKTIAGRIADTPGVHGIALAPELDRGFTSNGGENKVSIVDLKTLKTLDKVDTGGANPDAITYDPVNKQVWVFNHTGRSAAQIDAQTGMRLALVPLSGTAETGQVDAALGRVFVNIEDKSLIDVIDMATHTVVASWPVAPADGPTGMALDAATHRIFVGGGPDMVMIDARSGKVIASAPICRGTDATWYDPGAKMAFSSCGDGTITAVDVGSRALKVVQTIQTERGARTMALDPTTHTLYVVAQTYEAATPGAAPATPSAGRRGRSGPPAVPDSFHVLILGMSQ